MSINENIFSHDLTYKITTMLDDDVSYSKRYYEANKTKILAYQREYYRSKKKSRSGKIQVKHGVFSLFGPTTQKINWDEPCQCEICMGGA